MVCFQHKPITFPVSLKCLPCSLFDTCLGLVSWKINFMIVFYSNSLFPLSLLFDQTQSVSNLTLTIGVAEPLSSSVFCCASYWGDLSGNQPQQDAKCQLVVCERGSSFEHLWPVLKEEMPYCVKHLGYKLVTRSDVKIESFFPKPGGIL